MEEGRSIRSVLTPRSGKDGRNLGSEGRDMKGGRRVRGEGICAGPPHPFIPFLVHILSKCLAAHLWSGPS